MGLSQSHFYSFSDQTIVSIRNLINHLKILHYPKCSYSEILHQKIEKIHKKFMGLPHRFLNKELTRFFPGLRHTSGFVRLLWTSTVVNRVCTPYPLLPLEGSQPTSSSVTWSPAQSASSGLTTTISTSSPKRKPENKTSLPNSRTEIQITLLVSGIVMRNSPY